MIYYEFDENNKGYKTPKEQRSKLYLDEDLDMVDVTGRMNRDRAFNKRVAKRRKRKKMKR